MAATVVRMPPAWYGRPDMRALNSSVRSPAKTRWEWEFTKPGSTARPPASTRLSVAGALLDSPVHATRSPSMTTAASRIAPRGEPSPREG
ncbi:hypothetical protein SFUMM280S_00363 [Streptomyces fumanus]